MGTRAITPPHDRRRFAPCCERSPPTPPCLLRPRIRDGGCVLRPVASFVHVTHAESRFKRKKQALGTIAGRDAAYRSEKSSGRFRSFRWRRGGRPSNRRRLQSCTCGRPKRHAGFRRQHVINHKRRSLLAHNHHVTRVLRSGPPPPQSPPNHPQSPAAHAPEIGEPGGDDRVGRLHHQVLVDAAGVGVPRVPAHLRNLGTQCTRRGVDVA